MKKLILVGALGLLAGYGIGRLREHLDKVLEKIYGQSPWSQVPQEDEDEPEAHPVGLAFDVPRHRGTAGSVRYGEVV